MQPTEFLATLENDGAVVTVRNDIRSVANFGDSANELRSALSASVVCPLPHLIRIRATGNDRAKFLHNFCTGNVNALQSGESCEAFFTDVKAKILAHGIVLATPESHEIWMLPGDESAIVKHLNKYIITEDVTIESVEGQTAIAVIGLESAAVLQSAGFALNSDADSCVVNAEFGRLSLTWADADVSIVSVDTASAAPAWEKFKTAGAIPSGHDVFDHFRIMEGYPLIGTDMTEENMAPEADRNGQAICYTKGCYLGQEPIARLDAMGHVNRKLFKGTARVVSDTASSESATDLFEVTSASTVLQSDIPVLTVLPVKSVVPSQPVSAKLSDGRAVEITV